MEINEEITIGEVVAKDYRTASVFESLGIDFCCKGDRTINEACETTGIDINDLLEGINIALQKPVIVAINDYNNWPLDKLAQHIESRHHKYVEQQIPPIKQHLKRICDVHGKNHPELFEVKELFNTSVGELIMHMKKEELILFPFIKKMIKAKNKNEKIAPPHFGTVENPIQMMMDEHNNEGERFEKINKITQNYKLPDDACGTYRACFGYLKEFEEDLHLHIHLENNILFPKAIELEKQLTTNV
ncbi:MAG: iron-sulfur cluster repair di-iron protein [Vicingus serpentipes]|nr:iron-sulfur cluster repair di-iron protein [Vicingus serpentipes]